MSLSWKTTHKKDIVLGICLILCLMNFINNSISMLGGFQMRGGTFYQIDYYNSTTAKTNINNTITTTTTTTNDTATDSNNANTTNFTSNITDHDHRQEHDDYPFTFGACLLTKDDKQILPEWLAYHYTVLPLRHLIVAVDPLSWTDPRPIFDKYRQSFPDLKLEVWTNQYQYWPKVRFMKFNPKRHTVQAAGIMHDKRQSAFYTSCLSYLKEKSKEGKEEVPPWILLSDTDEYVAYNIDSPNLRNILPPRIGRQNETIAHYMAKNHYLDNNHTLCHVFPRINFLSTDEVGEKQLQQYLPTSSSSSSTSSYSTTTTNTTKNFLLDGKMFHTLQYQSIAKQGAIPGKSFVKLQSYEPRRHIVSNPHRPFKEACDNNVFPKISDVDTPIRFHQYSGTLQTFISRPERKKEVWLKRNKQAIGGYDDSLSLWLHEFTKLIPGGSVLKVYELTQQIRELAYNESIHIKERVEKYNETPKYIFDWIRVVHK